MCENNQNWMNHSEVITAEICFKLMMSAFSPTLNRDVSRTVHPTGMVLGVLGSLFRALFIDDIHFQVT